MVRLLGEARALLSRRGNDFGRSSWQDAIDAVAEIDRFVAAFGTGPVRKARMAILFAPTGPMQEVAEASGWGAAFLDLAARFDGIELVASASWSCRLCPAPAGTIELAENGDLRRASFVSVLTQRLSGPGALDRTWDAIVASDAAALFELDPGFVPWWCPACRASYCGDHWIVWDVADPGDPDGQGSPRGRCPDGHERGLER